MRRRTFVQTCSALALGTTVDSMAGAFSISPLTVVIDPEPLFEISSTLYMQFMEPLGTTDSSVEAAWDYDTDDWRKDFVDTVKDLAPGAMRFGGIFSRYYRWREGVGPVAKRPPMRNYAWGGKETNRVGTHEFVDFSRRVGAEPFYCVNFMSDGRQRFWKTRDGSRTGDAAEAADWVAYANDPDNPERRANGVAQPYDVKLWQLGNETSYGGDGFTKDESIQHTIEFAKAMKQRDPSIRLIGWGDRGSKPGEALWAAELLDRAGTYIDYVAIHMMQQHPRSPATVLNSLRYQQEPQRAWDELLEFSKAIELRIQELEEVIGVHKPGAGIAVTEGHLSLRPHNINPILSEWLTGVFHARSMNTYQRHGARVKIATACDFCGTRWTNNGVMLEVPRGVSYLMPAASVMRLFKTYNGTHGLAVKSCPSDLDIAASRAGNRVFLHVANLNYDKPASSNFAVEGMTITGGRVFEIAPQNLREAVNEDRSNVFAPQEKPLSPGPEFSWSFPPGSVSVVELDLSASSAQRLGQGGAPTTG